MHSGLSLIHILNEEEAKAKAEAESPLMKEAREMLVKWEANDPEVRALWKKMNDWVYAGFDETYRMMGVTFDKIYYESNTYLEGKEKVMEGLEKGFFYRKEDGSVWADLTGEGLDHKLLLRADGTSAVSYTHLSGKTVGCAGSLGYGRSFGSCAVCLFCRSFACNDGTQLGVGSLQIGSNVFCCVCFPEFQIGGTL